MGNITVIGGGAWGAALADQLASRQTTDPKATGNHLLHVLVRDDATAQALREGHVPRLGQIPLRQPLKASTDTRILSSAQMIFLVLPLSAHESAAEMIATYASDEAILVFAAKGLMDDSEKGGLFLNEWASQHPSFGRRAVPPVILTGPSFADEVIAGKPTALVAACADKQTAISVSDVLSHGHFRCYHHGDPMGAAIGGAAKNVMAIAAGICAGLGLGDNARAALITRGLAEMQRLGQRLGAEPTSFAGLSGLGDLTLSCSSPHSRNMAFGLALGRGEAPAETLAEGRHAASKLAKRARFESVDMPIVSAIDQVLNNGADMKASIEDLLARDVGAE